MLISLLSPNKYRYATLCFIFPVRPTLRSILLLLALTLSVAGCGYKGPLYLPGSKPAAKKPAPEPVASPVTAPTTPAEAQQTP